MMFLDMNIECAWRRLGSKMLRLGAGLVDYAWIVVQRSDGCFRCEIGTCERLLFDALAAIC